jgi:hypothetical protein
MWQTAGKEMVEHERLQPLLILGQRLWREKLPFNRQ